jgi:hypothetical protein
MTTDLNVIHDFADRVDDREIHTTEISHTTEIDLVCVLDTNRENLKIFLAQKRNARF